MPVRIQRKRTRGWKMPPNVKYIGRPTKWGNPFRIGDKVFLGRILTREDAINAYEDWLKRALIDNPHFLDELKGKDLACWCPLEDKKGNPVPCHADVIIKIMKERGLQLLKLPEGEEI